MPGSPVIATIAPRPSASSCEHLVERGHLGVSADQRREPAWLALSLAADPEDEYGEGLALEGERPDRLQLECVFDLARGCRTDGDASRTGLGLQARRRVHGVAQCVEALLVRSSVGEQDHRACVDANAAGELDAVRLLHVLRVAGERRLHRERRAHRPLRVVVVRVGNTEERVQPVPGELRDRPAEALHLAGEQPRHLVEEEFERSGPSLSPIAVESAISARSTETMRRSPTAQPSGDYRLLSSSSHSRVGRTGTRRRAKGSRRHECNLGKTPPERSLL